MPVLPYQTEKFNQIGKRLLNGHLASIDRQMVGGKARGAPHYLGT
jgi:hypothetical protein